MKNLIYTILLLVCFVEVNAQTVQATVRKISDGCVTVFARPTADLNEPPSNILFSVSVPEQSGTNPSVFLSNVIDDMQLDGGSPPPYTLGGRYYVDLNFTPSVANPAPLGWINGTEYPLATVCFNGADPAPAAELVQLNDLAATGGGNNFFTYWYFETQGSGDITDYGARFYDDGGTTAIATNGGDSQVETTESIILPIELTTFELSKDGKSVDLSWTTSSEINGSHFEIERSQDGDNWNYVGSVDAVGESAVEQYYAYNDSTLPLNTRENQKVFYYRLKMVDNDGSSEYSDIRLVRFDLDDEASFLVYPNPTYNEVYVNLSAVNAETGPAILQVIDIQGQLVKQVSINSSDDLRVNVSDLTPGAYNFVARHGAQNYVQKVLKIQ